MLIDNVQHFHDLFCQLGLPASNAEIADFIRRNRIPNDLLMAEAPFWNDAQREFIVEKKRQDSPEWTQLIDQLNTALRETPEPEQAD